MHADEMLLTNREDARPSDLNSADPNSAHRFGGKQAHDMSKSQPSSDDEDEAVPSGGGLASTSQILQKYGLDKGQSGQSLSL